MAFNKEDYLHPGEIRPRFKLHSSLNADDTLACIKEAAEADETVYVRYVMHYAHVYIPRAEKHYWSPVLHVGVVDEEDSEHDGAVIRCLIGPNSQVWTMFMFFYGLIAVVGLFGAMYGLSEWTLDRGSGFLWSIPIAMVLWLLVYLAAKYGQRQGHEQMVHLIRFLYKALEKAEVERVHQ